LEYSSEAGRDSGRGIFDIVAILENLSAASVRNKSCRGDSWNFDDSALGVCMGNRLGKNPFVT
jgi:hypothetical protein